MNTKLKICVIEDNQVVAKLMAHKLEKRFKGTVSTFETVEEALSKIIIDHPDVIVSDYYFGTKEGCQDGVHLLKQLKRREISIPVVMCSSNIEKSLALQLLTNGACDFVLKDGDFFGPLLESVRNVVLRSRIKEDIVTVQHHQRENVMSMVTALAMSFTLIMAFMLF